MAKKKSISIASRKAKARRIQQWGCQKVSDILGIPWGKDELIRSREMGQSGIDVVLIGLAQELFPFSVECKNAESWDLPGHIRQAKANQKKDTDWMLMLKKNNHEEIIVMDGESFFKMFQELHNFRKKKRSNK